MPLEEKSDDRQCYYKSSWGGHKYLMADAFFPNMFQDQSLWWRLCQICTFRNSFLKSVNMTQSVTWLRKCCCYLKKNALNQRQSVLGTLSTALNTPPWRWLIGVFVYARLDHAAEWKTMQQQQQQSKHQLAVTLSYIHLHTKLKSALLPVEACELQGAQTKCKN